MTGVMRTVTSRKWRKKAENKAGLCFWPTWGFCLPNMIMFYFWEPHTITILKRKRKVGKWEHWDDNVTSGWDQNCHKLPHKEERCLLRHKPDVWREAVGKKPCFHLWFSLFQLVCSSVLLVKNMEKRGSDFLVISDDHSVVKISGSTFRISKSHTIAIYIMCWGMTIWYLISSQIMGSH